MDSSSDLWYNAGQVLHEGIDDLDSVFKRYYKGENINV